jgi:ElaB/YqjD/DUF883 family membrane-anchored ribosome-binding protein
MANPTDGATQRRGEDEFAAANETPWRGMRDEVEIRMDEARDALTRADESLRQTVRERPFVAVGVALAVGYLISRGLSRH